MTTIDEVMELAHAYRQSKRFSEQCDARIALRAAIESLAQPRKWERLTDEEVKIILNLHDVGKWYELVADVQDELIRKNGGE